MFDDPLAEEELTVPIGVDINPSGITSANTPAGVPPINVTGGFAPAFATDGVPLTTATVQGDIPRFVFGTSGAPISFTFEKCVCNLLFPFVTSTNSGAALSFDTGIAIANTSLSPTDPVYVQTLNQAGPVQLWYFQGGALAKTECSNTAVGARGSCLPANSATSRFVLGGETLLFTVANGNSGLCGMGFAGKAADAASGCPAGVNFSGYVIAKASFQYCHGFAFFSDLNRAAVPGIYGTSVGYLALVMDSSGARLPRTVNTINFDSLDN